MNTTLSDLASLYASMKQKPRVFVSYHHDVDQYWYDRLSSIFGDAYDIITDRSVDEPFDSTDTEYLRRAIRENHISGTSATIVLCGTESWKRKWIDWEIQMTLNKEHGLMGIVLPTQPQGTNAIVPQRLYDNIQTGYANWIHWTEDAQAFRTGVETARQNSGFPSRISNSRPAISRNLP